MQALSGRPLNLEGVTAHGNTDTGILRDALELAGVHESVWRPHLPQMRLAMAQFVAKRETELCATALPFVAEVLQHLQRRGATLGIATGNLREIGQLKLKRAGLLDYFKVGGWSDAYEHRTDVFRGAVALMREETRPNAAICVVGDTPADVLAARANHLPVIAVATGVYSQQQLAETHPDLCLASFEELCPRQQESSQVR